MTIGAPPSKRCNRNSIFLKQKYWHSSTPTSGKSCLNDSRGSSKWVVGALGWGSSCGNILCHYRRIRRGEENYIWRKIHRVPQSTLQNPADVWERSDGHPICGELDTSNKCDRVFPPNPSPLARGEVCHRAPPKTDKHGIHQGSGKHVTSSTLLLCHTMSGSVISCLKVW